MLPAVFTQSCTTASLKLRERLYLNETNIIRGGAADVDQQAAGKLLKFVNTKRGEADGASPRLAYTILIHFFIFKKIKVRIFFVEYTVCTGNADHCTGELTELAVFV